MTMTITLPGAISGATSGTAQTPARASGTATANGTTSVAASAATSSRATTSQRTVSGEGTNARPFAQMLDDQQPVITAAAVPAVAAATQAAADVDTSPVAATLMPSLATLVTEGAQTAPVAATVDVLADQADAGDDQDAATADASTVAQSLLSLVMPSLFPTVMPPAPVVASVDGTDTADGANAATGPDGLSATGARSTPLSGAVSADAAQLLSVKTQGAISAGDATLTATDANPTPVGDSAAWVGLQRWSAELMAAPSATTAGADRTLALPTDRPAWQQPLMQALGDQLQLQALQRADQARLHLMPPQLGRIEIDIRQQGGALQVQLVATHDEVRQQLRQIAEPLRQELVQRHTGDVSVQVATGAQAAGDGRGRDGAAGGQTPQGQAGSGSQRDAQRQPGRALGDDDILAHAGFSDALARQVQA